MKVIKKHIKKAQNGLEDLKKKEDSLYTANRKLAVEKALENAGYLDQQRSLKAKFNEAAKNRNAKLPKKKNGGSVKAKSGKTIKKAQNGWDEFTNPEPTFIREGRITNRRANEKDYEDTYRKTVNGPIPGYKSKVSESETNKVEANYKKLHPNNSDVKKKNGGKVVKKAKSGTTVAKAKDGKWIQKAVNPAHKGYCTPMTKATCTPKRKALAKAFKAMAAKRKSK